MSFTWLKDCYSRKKVQNLCGIWKKVPFWRMWLWKMAAILKCSWFTIRNFVLKFYKQQMCKILHLYGSLKVISAISSDPTNSWRVLNIEMAATEKQINIKKQRQTLGLLCRLSLLFLIIRNIMLTFQDDLHKSNILVASRPKMPPYHLYPSKSTPTCL